LKSDFLCYSDDGGLFADFHSMRHVFITSRERAGLSPKMVQTLARHPADFGRLHAHRLARLQRGDRVAAGAPRGRWSGPYQRKSRSPGCGGPALATDTATSATVRKPRRCADAGVSQCSQPVLTTAMGKDIVGQTLQSGRLSHGTGHQIRVGGGEVTAEGEEALTGRIGGLQDAGAAHPR
jgi:hypothetical protein